MDARVHGEMQLRLCVRTNCSVEPNQEKPLKNIQRGLIRIIRSVVNPNCVARLMVLTRAGFSFILHEISGFGLTY